VTVPVDLVSVLVQVRPEGHNDPYPLGLQVTRCVGAAWRQLLLDSARIAASLRRATAAGTPTRPRG
jgi:hypothetical protein